MFQKNLVARFLNAVDLTLGDEAPMSKKHINTLKKEEQIIVENLLKQGSLPI